MMKETPAALTRFRYACFATVSAAALACARAEEAAERAPDRPQCFSTTQTREKIEKHKLTDPFTCMRAEAAKLNGEPIGARLCRLAEIFIYEISVLQPDGRVVKIHVDATTGRPHSGRKEN
ncbi:hypothetical protein LG047_05075 [Methylocystis sp. WRRC1]|uniref:PepSY domain-containing protein n=1 Tax=Methylocystis sp. WRRC1 TaxID=1732014 RepID=UPI001D134B90|nr:hypothetical protein [Methylocystis sp. WRRC1]MCC3244697.1 hypothetical protein [Methylocystis sp. WRRC1]